MNKYPRRSQWLVIAIPLAAILIAVFLMRTRPRAERRKPPVQTPVVEATSLQRDSYRAMLPAMGTVQPAADITLKARVTGDILATHPNWFVGGRVQKGETLVTIDPTDYQIALAEAEAQVAQAESDLQLEKGRQDVAAREWALLAPDGGGSQLDRTLALRKPQLAAAEARVEAARARRNRAAIDLERTRLLAPFNGIILDRGANIGDQATPQLALAQLAATDSCHIVTPVPVTRLPHLDLPQGEQPGATASVRWPNGTERNGHVIALLGSLEQKGSMAQLLVDVPIDSDAAPLFGSYVELTIKGNELPPAYRIPRQALVDGETALLLSTTNTLRIAPVRALWNERDAVICDMQAQKGDRLITSGLAAPVEGMQLRTPGNGNQEKPAGGRP